MHDVLDGKTQQSELNGLEAAYYKICKSFLTGDVTTSNAWAAYTSRIQATALLTKENLDENQPPLSLGSQEIKIPEELLEEEKNTFLQIIVGEKPPEYFDTFVKKWYENGGLLTKENLDENQPPLSLGSQEIKIPEELLEEEKNTFLQIIVGEKPPEYFDTFVKKWYENGGKALTQQADDSYKETMK